MSVAQQTKQAPDLMTEQMSQVLVRNVFRTVLSSICFVRNIFPDDCFEERKVSGLVFKTLVARNSEAETLINWLESGVFDALSKRYLRRLLLEFGSMETGKVIEFFSFDVKYGSDGTPELEVRDSKTGKTIRGHSFSRDDRKSTKGLLVSMIRSLCLLNESIPELPANRFVSMKLLYHEDVTPVDYEPPFFKSIASDQQLPSYLTRCSSRPESGAPEDTRFFGNMATPYHSLRFAFEQCCESGDAGEVSFSQTGGWSPSNIEDDQGQDHSMEDHAVGTGGPSEGKEVDDNGCVDGEGSIACHQTTLPDRFLEALSAVMDQKKCTYDMLRGILPGASNTEVRIVYTRLQKEGFTVRSGRSVVVSTSPSVLERAQRLLCPNISVGMQESAVGASGICSDPDPVPDAAASHHADMVEGDGARPSNRSTGSAAPLDETVIHELSLSEDSTGVDVGTGTEDTTVPATAEASGSGSRSDSRPVPEQTSVTKKRAAPSSRGYQRCPQKRPRVSTVVDPIEQVDRRAYRKACGETAPASDVLRMSQSPYSYPGAVHTQ